MTGEHDLSELIKNNEETLLQKKALYIRKEKAKASEKLLIIMSTHNHGQRYMALRSFVNNQLFDLLFITDPNNTWYLDDDLGESYNHLISHYSDNYKPENVFLFGSSMSGYGAILHALSLNLNAIAFNPQINLDITKNYAWPELITHIDALNGKHINIENITNSTWKNSAIYLIHGHDDLDVINAKLFLDAQPNQKKLIVQILDIESHVLDLAQCGDYTYDLIDILSSLRSRSDLSSITEKITPEAKQLRKSLRLERENSPYFDPIRSLLPPSKGKLWQYRSDLKATDKPVSFSNTGFYRGTSIAGTICQLTEGSWKLTHPKFNTKADLIFSHTLETEGKISCLEDDFFINRYWRLRNKSHSFITVDGKDDAIEVFVHDAKDKNIYLHSSVVSPAKINALKGQFLTFTADVFTSDGEATITLGGVGDFGYHHKNSEKSTPAAWKKLVVFEQFLSVNRNHQDRVFVRFNLASDGKNKVVKIKNICLTIGYFPMGFSKVDT